MQRNSCNKSKNKEKGHFLSLSNAVVNLMFIVNEYNKYTYNYMYVSRIAIKAQFGLIF